MRVLLVTSLFQPEPNHLKGLDYAKSIRAAGIDLRVLTGFPNYPLGRTYPGYRQRPLLRETIEGVPVTRSAVFPSHDGSSLRRIATYMSLGLSTALAVAAGSFRPDVVHVYLGAPTLAFPAWIAKRLYNARVLLDVQDLWPESVTESRISTSRPVATAARALSRWAYRQGDSVVALSLGCQSALTSRGVDPRRLAVIRNWCDERQIPTDGPNRARQDPRRGLRVLYAGNLGAAQGLDVVARASSLLESRSIPAEFVLVGAGTQHKELQDRVSRDRLTRVRFVGPLPASDMAEEYAQADAVLIHLKSSPLSRVGIPQKVQMGLAVGKPILIGVDGEATDLVREAGAGVCFEPGSPEGLADAVSELAAMGPLARERLGQNGRQYYYENLSFRRGVRQFIEAYASVLRS